MAHGSDIGVSIRIPASLCGGVGLKPSRMRVSIGPAVDEGGWGYSLNLVQAKSLRDTATILDCVSTPQPGDPFVIPKPDEPFAVLAKKPAPRLRVGIVLDELAGVRVDPEVARAVEARGKTLANMGHHVECASADMGGAANFRATTDIFFFSFNSRLDGYAQRSGHKPGPETLQAVILSVYEHAKQLTPARFMTAERGQHRAPQTRGFF
jgi:amidase